MKHRILAVAVSVALLMMLAPGASAAPLTFPTWVEDGFAREDAPDITAATWILYDESNEAVLGSSSPTRERAMASTTKIMTGLLTVEHGHLDETVTISGVAADTGEREIDLFAGEIVTLGALLKAAMIHSANDAATAIAEHIGGSVEGFVEMMNDRARELGLTETHFANPHGLDAPGHYSSARDLLDLARVAMQHEAFRDAVRSRMVVFPDAPDGSRRIGTTTNLLLGEFEGAEGIKTGFTSQALLTFVAAAERQGRRLYVVVLGSDGRRAHFADAEALFDHGFAHLGIFGSLSTGAAYVSLRPTLERSPLVATSTVETLIHLADQGLLSDPPAPLTAVPEPEPPPITVVERRPEPEHQGLWDAVVYWFRGLGD